MPFVDRISTLDPDYITGDLSIYPVAKDTIDTLYDVRNNAETKLTQSFNYSAAFLVVEDTSSFPPRGLIRVGLEIIYYDQKTSVLFQNLKRGFAGSRQNAWPAGTIVSGSVMAEVHNAVKDATINIETNLGTQDDPTPESLNGILKALEVRFLSPKPIFRAGPLKGPPPLTVTFQNFSGGAVGRFLWDFGDGGTSVETAPTHTYLAEGEYTVKLNMITSLGAQGIATKTGYIKVSESERQAFFYATPLFGTTATQFSFVDQTDGPVLRRYWIFDDGTNDSELDPSIHFTTHQYSLAGTYNPSLIVEFQDGTIERLTLPDQIVVV